MCFLHLAWDGTVYHDGQSSQTATTPFSHAIPSHHIPSHCQNTSRRHSPLTAQSSKHGSRCSPQKLYLLCSLHSLPPPRPSNHVQQYHHMSLRTPNSHLRFPQPAHTITLPLRRQVQRQRLTQSRDHLTTTHHHPSLKLSTTRKRPWLS